MNLRHIMHANPDDPILNFSWTSAGVRLLSLDVFDTLLIRLLSEPEDVFDQVGQLAAESGLLADGIEPRAFKHLRQIAAHQAYVKARSVGRADPRLTEIYAFLEPVLVDTKRVLSIELSVEATVLRANPEMLGMMATAQKHGVDIVLCSDMYLSRPELSQLLSGCGIRPDTYRDLLISSETEVSKSTGAMYAELLARNPLLSPDQILHIGDNVVSDVEAAIRFGLRAIHYPTFRGQHSPRLINERLFGCTRLDAIETTRKLACSRVEPDSAGSAWFRLGAEVIGPFVTLFAEWVIRTCIARGIVRICPLMRDAHTLGPALLRAAERLEAKVEVVPAYISRLASCFAAFDSATTDAISRWLQLAIPVRVFFQRLHVEVPSALMGLENTPLLSLRSVTIEKNGLDIHEYLKGYLNQPDLKSRVELALTNERTLLAEYLNSLASDHNQLAIVDYSHHATVGSVLDRLSRSVEGLPRILSCITYGEASVIAREWLSGHEVRCYLGGPGQNQSVVNRICTRSALLEELFYGDEGTTLGFTRTEKGIVQPVLDQCPFDSQELMARHICQAGIEAFQRTWNHLQPSTTPTAATLARMLLRLIELPTREEAALLTILRIDDGFGGAEPRSVCPDSASQELERLGLHAFLQTALRPDQARHIYWPEGVVARDQPGQLVANHYHNVTMKHSDELPEQISNPLFRFYLLALRIHGTGARSVCIHGARDAGRYALEAMSWAGLKVIALADRDAALLGTTIGNLKVRSHAEAATLKPDAAVIASLIASQSIKNSLARVYGSGTPIFSPWDIDTPF